MRSSQSSDKPFRRGVLIAPGEILFTLILNSPSSNAVVCDKFITAALAAEYACGPPPPYIPAIEAVLIIEAPLEFFFISTDACFIPMKTDLRSIAID